MRAISMRKGEAKDSAVIASGKRELDETAQAPRSYTKKENLTSAVTLQAPEIVCETTLGSWQAAF